MKYNFSEEKYAEMVDKCNKEPNKYIIVDTGETFEVREIVYDLNEEKNIKLQSLYHQYKNELSLLLDPTELQACMTLANEDELIDIIDSNGVPQQYTADEMTTLLNDSLTQRNELLQRYKEAYKKIKNAKKVETIHGVTF